MSPSDQKIIDNHPEASPYDLFNTYGLTKKGYDEFLTLPPNKLQPQSDKKLVPETVVSQPSNLLVPELVKQTNKHTISPQLTPYIAPSMQSGGDVVVRTKGSGKLSPMTKFAADRLVRRHPSTYEIV